MVAVNEASWDRIVRVVLGLALIVAGLMWAQGGVATALIVVGLIPLLTGIVGFCPLYKLLGISTSK